MNVQDVITRVKRTFGDEAGVQITDADLLRWINDAQLEIGRNNEGLMETTSVTDIVAEQADYTMPENFSVLRSLKYNGYRLKPMSLAEFNEYIDGYEAANNTYGSSTPEVFTVWDTTVTLFPKPNQSFVGGLKIYYIRHPAEVTNLADALTVPTAYHNSVVTYCLQQAYELDEDQQKADRTGLKFNDDMMKINDRNKWIAQEYYPRITTLPEDENYGSHGSWGGYY